MGCRFFKFFHHCSGAGEFLRPVPDRVTRHPVREKEAPSATALQRNRSRGEGRKKFEQLQQSIPALQLEGSPQGQRQSFLADQRHKASPGYLPKAALHESLQPPFSPALQSAPIYAQSFSQNPHSLRFDPVVSRGHQHDDHAPVNPATQETHRGRRVAFAAPVQVTAETSAISLLDLLGSAAGFAFVFGAMQFARAVQAAILADFFGQVRIDFFQELM